MSLKFLSIGTSNIPPRNLKNATVNIFLGSQAQSRSTVTKQAAITHPKKKRNATRTQRAKLYFLRKRAQHRENNNSTNQSEVEVQANDNMVVVDVESSVADSPDILVINSSDDSNSSNWNLSPTIILEKPNRKELSGTALTH